MDIASQPRLGRAPGASPMVVFVMALLGLFLVGTPPACACRYTVREVGYVGLGTPSYRLLAYTDAQTPTEVVERLKRIAYAALMDTGIQAVVVAADHPDDPADLQYLKTLGLSELPAAALIDGRGRALSIPLLQPGLPARETIWEACEGLVSSPVRTRLVEHLGYAFAVVLLIEGTDAGQNAAARRDIEAAIEAITPKLPHMAKPVEHPPVLLPVSQEARLHERVLLWDLGLRPDDSNDPYAAVVYGRVRRVGPLLRGGAVTEENVSALLEVVGADCECGIDRRWMTGETILVRWDKNVRQRVADALGFDPENPLVKTEVSQILQYAPEGTGALDGVQAIKEYQEFTVELASDSTRLPPAVLNPAQAAPASAQGSPSSEPPAGSPPLPPVTYVMAALAASIPVICLALYLRSRSQ